MWIALVLGLVEPDPREGAIDQLAKRDLAVFLKADVKFGMGRMEGIDKVAGDHGLLRLFASGAGVADRFLVGNQTASFTIATLRTSFVPITFQIGKPGAPSPKPRFKTSEIERLVRRNFGKEFTAKVEPDSWLVKGFLIRAKPDCLSCHHSAKSGDPLGYLVYAAPKPYPTISPEQ